MNEAISLSLTKYVVGARANPPKNPRRLPKKGMQIATTIVKAEQGRPEKTISCIGEKQLLTFAGKHPLKSVL